MTSRSEIVVVGAGSLGQTFSAALGSSGVPVVLVATGRSTPRLLSAGKLSIRGMLQFSVPVAEAAVSGAVRVSRGEDLTNVRGIIFATKGHDLRSAAQELSGVKSDWVAGIQNGVAKDDLLAEIFGRDRVLGAAGNLAAERQDDGSVLVTNRGMTYIGELDGASSERAEGLVADLKAAGISAQLSPNIRSVEWSKAVIVAGGFGVGVLTRAVWSESMEDPNLTRAFLSLAREAAAIAKAEGVEIADFPGSEALTYVSQPDEKSIASRAERVRKLRAEGGELDRRSSIVQDLLSGRRLEADFIFDDFVTRARKHGVPAPRLELVRDLARGIDASKSRSIRGTAAP